MLLAVARAACAAGRIALHPDTLERDRHPRRFWLLVAVHLLLGLGGVAFGVAIWLGWVPVASAYGG
jgi:CHASE2 domain-containing sensor protein